MRMPRNILLSAPVLAVALLVFTSIAAAQTPPAPPAPGLSIDSFRAKDGRQLVVVIGLGRADPEAAPN